MASPIASVFAHLPCVAPHPDRSRPGAARVGTFALGRLQRRQGEPPRHIRANGTVSVRSFFHFVLLVFWVADEKKAIPALWRKGQVLSARSNSDRLWLMSDTIGLNEALILWALSGGNELRLAQIVERLNDTDDGQSIREATVYVALQRMAERGFVQTRKVRVVSRDERAREIGLYKVTDNGLSAARIYARKAQPLQSLTPVGVTK